MWKRTTKAEKNHKRLERLDTQTLLEWADVSVVNVGQAFNAVRVSGQNWAQLDVARTELETLQSICDILTQRVYPENMRTGGRLV